MTLPTDRQVFQFDHASVVYTCENDARGRPRPSLHVQLIDAYRYQREFGLSLRHRETLSNTYWEAIVYTHPGRHAVYELSDLVATRFINKFLDQSQHPVLLFNTAGEDGRARAEGFVHLHEKMFTTPPSVKLF